MRAIIVDDVATNLMLLGQVVRKVGGCEPLAFTDPLLALKEVGKSDVDLILVDYRMPVMNGVEFIRELRRIPRAEDVPIVMVTTSDERDVRLAALQCGATEFLTKPIDVAEVQARIRNMLKLREAQNKLRDKAAWLEGEVKKATAALAAREEEVIMRLSRAAEHRDAETGDHLVRMALYCRLIAQSLGLDARTCHEVYLAAPMHDIGKIAVNDAILLNADALSQSERWAMQQHTIRGYQILADSDSELIRMAADIAYCHHERWDGTGYPRGLRGPDIPLFARIAAVADVFDALTSKRPYKPAWTADEARAYINAHSGQQFDPDCVRAFLDCWDDVLKICSNRSSAVAEAKVSRTADVPTAAK
jgi:putative two-component system response regulator